MARGPEWRDYSAEVQRYDSVALRFVLAGGGMVCVGLGVAGLFLPVLPTTPFLLLAAALFARSSRRVYNWLLNHPVLGPIILEWREHRAMPRRAKRVALVLIAVSFTVSIVFFVPDWRGQLVMGAAGVVLWLWIWRIPSRDVP